MGAHSTDKEHCTVEQLAEYLRVDPTTGDIFRIRSARLDCVREVRKIETTGGYYTIWAMGRLFRWHRVVWALSTGAWPKDMLDHINHDRKDNRLCNLREATRSQNFANRIVRSNSKTGVKGVEYDRRRGRKPYSAYIGAGGKKRYLGCFETAELAHAAYMVEARKVHGEFAYGGK